MKHANYDAILHCFTHLPKQILTLHEIDNVTEYVLHSLCQEGCLNFSKAAYFIDNPDFNFLKGIAGFDKDDEIYTCESIIAEDGSVFTERNNCSYNQKVREITISSPKRNGEPHEKMLEKLVEVLDMSNPSYHSWNIKHDNFGLLIYECSNELDQKLHEEFLHGLSILGFCPVS
jgi:hypothetical protein